MKSMESLNSNSTEAVFDKEDSWILERALGGYIDGIDLETSGRPRPKPFDIELRDFYTQDELETVLSGKSEEETQKIIDQNNENMFYNNEALDELNEHILQIAELTSEERDDLYHDENTSDSDKSILACIEAVEQYAYYGRHWIEPVNKVIQGIIEDASSMDAFRILMAKKILDGDKEAHFNIRLWELASPLYDMASTALKHFAINCIDRDSMPERIKKYDNYLYEMALDCMKRRVGLDEGEFVVKTDLDIEEFQDRIIESMNGYILDENSAAAYSEEDFAAMQARVPEMLARSHSGYHFRSEKESGGASLSEVSIIGKEEEGGKSIYWYYDDDISDEKSEAYWAEYKKNMRRLNKAIFNYSEAITTIEMKRWANRIDYEAIDEINKEDTTYEEKYEKIVRLLQRNLYITRPDWRGESTPLEIDWFHHSEKWYKRRYKDFPENAFSEEEEKEDWSAGYYRHGEDRRVHFARPDEPNKKRALQPWEIGVIVHEVWHAKQHDMMDEKDDDDYDLMTDKQRRRQMEWNAKVRMYKKNNAGYIVGKKDKKAYKQYRMQMMEKEAFKLESLAVSKYRAFKQKKRNKSIFRVIADLLNE